MVTYFRMYGSKCVLILNVASLKFCVHHNSMGSFFLRTAGLVYVSHHIYMVLSLAGGIWLLVVFLYRLSAVLH